MLKIALFATVAIMSVHRAYANDCTNPANAGMGECPTAAPAPAPTATPAIHHGQHQSLTTSQLNNQSFKSAINNRINTGGNSQTVVVGGGLAAGDYRSAPSYVATGIIGGGSDCPTVGVTPAGSGLGGGGGIGVSWISPDCNARKLAEEVAALGRPDVSLELLRQHFPELAKAIAATPAR